MRQTATMLSRNLSGLENFYNQTHKVGMNSSQEAQGHIIKFLTLPTNSSNSSQKPSFEFLTIPIINTVRYILASCLILILITAVLGNTILTGMIAAIRRFHSVTHVFIVNLAVGNIMVALLVMPFDIDYLIRGYFSFSVTTCELSSTAFFLSLPASAVTLCLLTTERYLTLRFPMRHRSGALFTKPRIVVTLVCTWLYVTITASLPALGWKIHPTLVMGGECLVFFPTDFAILMLGLNFILPLLVIIAVNINIFHLANKRTKRLHSIASFSRPCRFERNATIRRTSNSIGRKSFNFDENDETRSGDYEPDKEKLIQENSGTVMATNNRFKERELGIRREPNKTPTSSQQESSLRRRTGSFARISRKVSRIQIGISQTVKNKQAAKTILFLVSIFVLCWLPYIITVAVNIRCKGCISQSVVRAMNALTYCSAALSPIMYGLRKKEIKLEIARAMRIRSKRNNKHMMQVHMKRLDSEISTESIQEHQL